MPRLDHEGIDFINYPSTTKEAVHRAAVAWERFTQLPQETKDQFSAKGLQFSVGYEHKGNGSRESKDVKENFDVTLAGIKAMKEGMDTAAADELLQAASELFNTLGPVADGFCKAAEATYDLPGFRNTAARSAVNRFIRFLHYPAVPEGTVIGEAHADHSGYTFHLYESTGGCHGLSVVDETWFDMPVASDEMLVFGGMQLQLLSEGRIKALSHEITANSTTSTVGRHAIVCFNVLDGMPTYDRNTHGRLQDKPAGFNYGLSPAEFSTLFSDNK